MRTCRADSSILQLSSAFKSDTNEKKVNLGVGAYRDEHGKPWVLPAVREAITQLYNDPDWDHEYLPIPGYPDFLKASAELLFGKDAAAIREQRLVTNQMISGSGANHMGASLLSRFYNFRSGRKVVYVSKPTWPNHYAMMHAADLETEDYTYYDPKTFSLDFEGMKQSLRSIPDGSVVLLHACAHNPSGVDPSQEQWKELVELFAQKQHFAFFDCAYQGFASGDADKDAFAVRLFEAKRIPMLVCQSFAKNTGLYGERIGALHVIVDKPEATAPVQSQINALQRSEISTCPAFGARVVAKLLTEPKLRAQWDRDIQTMAHRIMDMRKALYDLLVNKYKTPGSWKHIVDQIGMFSFLGLNADQCERMIRDGHIYLVKTSRISVSGLNPGNVDYVASWIDRMVREAKL